MKLKISNGGISVVNFREKREVGITVIWYSADCTISQYDTVFWLLVTPNSIRDRLVEKKITRQHREEKDFDKEEYDEFQKNHD